MKLDPRLHAFLRQHGLRLAPLAVFLVIALALSTGLFVPKRVQQSPLVGMVMPDFQLDRLEPNTPPFNTLLWRGRPALVNVFASWCEPCKAEHPVLMKLAQERVINIYGINWRDTREKATAYINSNGNPYQAIGLDTQALLTVTLGISGVPETYFIDSQGIVRWKHSAPLTEEVVQTTLLPLIKQYATPPAQ